MTMNELATRAGRSAYAAEVCARHGIPFDGGCTTSVTLSINAFSATITVEFDDYDADGELISLRSTHRLHAGMLPETPRGTR